MKDTAAGGFAVAVFSPKRWISLGSKFQLTFAAYLPVLLPPGVPPADALSARTGGGGEVLPSRLGILLFWVNAPR